MSQAIAEKLKVDTKALESRLLDVHNWIKAEKFEYVPEIEEAISEAREVLQGNEDSEELKPLRGLLNWVEPDYVTIKQWYETNPNFRKEIDTLRDYRRHMDALKSVIDGINHLRATPDMAEQYSRVVSAASLFYHTNWQHLPQKRAAEFSEKLSRARSRLPSRSDYRR